MILYNPTVSGSLLVTGSLTTTGTITSQTLVVQTITSSIEFVTGSTRNGTLSTNTHEFTGSVLMSGSVGIGTSSPSGKFVVIGANSGSYLSIDNSGAGENYFGANAFHVFQTAGSERIRITSSGSVGIGTNSPITTLTVQGGVPDDPLWGQTFISDNRAYNTANLGGRISLGGTFASSTEQTYFGLIQGLKENTNYNDYAGALTFSTRVNGVGTFERMRISSAGVVTRPFQPFAMGALSTDQSIPLNTFTVLNFRTDQGFYGVNTNSCWNNSTYTFTAPVTGVYLVNVSLLTNSVGQVALHVNGTRKHSIPSWLGASSVTWGGSAMIPLTAGEALTLQGYGVAGTLTANVYHTWFAIYLL
jgi:hypothetical protein